MPFSLEFRQTFAILVSAAEKSAGFMVVPFVVPKLALGLAVAWVKIAV